jgi:hypothetical protein
MVWLGALVMLINETNTLSINIVPEGSGSRVYVSGVASETQREKLQAIASGSGVMGAAGAMGPAGTSPFQVS